MRQKRFPHSSLVELAVLGVIVLILVTVGVASKLSRSDGAELSPAATPAASPGIDATPDVGQVIALPSSSSLSGGLTLVRTDKAPAISEQEAVKIIHDYGVPIGENRDGQVVTYTATYGIGTLGRSGGPGLPWWGVRNIPLKGTDVVLDHVEHRPMWIIDCDNMYAVGTQATFKHGVYAVDDQTGTILAIWFYDQVSSFDVPVDTGG
ncbi:hypothetical protein [Nitrolancea hollandica]|uniref:Uncharacterized protein n=1 Tax=Nitrolancea hollandica Lb TaxID=1129897 RepID=I4ENE1_9BACT|nr:hypothetical protein [Nitrolancea hollandica]CCF86204.1 exported hypothetical protein [Nitrolancea hollandica Lb]